MDLVQGMEATLRPTVSPRLFIANQILGLSLPELEATVRSELAANPALSLEEGAACPRCGSSLDGPYCQLCQLDAELPSSMPGDELVERVNSQLFTGDDDFDPMTVIASEISLAERILSDVAAVLDPRDKPVAEYLVNCLDERGYLDVPLEIIAAQLGRPLAEVERVLLAVQQVAPAGVGARDVRECLLLQLAYLAQQGRPLPPGAECIVANHLNDLAAHRYSQLSRKLHLPIEAVRAAHEFIRTSLNPFPLQHQEATRWKTPTRFQYVVPDVVVRLRDGRFTIELLQSRATRLRLDPLYASLSADIRRGGLPIAADERSHVRQHVTRARLFIASVNQRYKTLYRISECLLELQRDFVLHGVRELQPLTRGMVAERVGVHESTVSRATAHKHLMLPSREVIPFSTFFAPSLSIKDVIREMISQEQRPLTDSEICERLRRQGIRIARRTVAKYRGVIGIPPSVQRVGATA